MKDFVHAGGLLFLDMASTVFFLVLYLLTKNLVLAVALGIALGVAQILWEVARRRPIDTMQWVSLVVILASGTATLITQDPRFMMIKLSVIYTIIGGVMLKPGWLDRYQPPIALELLPDLITIFGFVWAGLMFLSAAVNAVAALTLSVAGWAAFMSVFGIASKSCLFLAQYAIMRLVGARRGRAQRLAAA